MKHYFYNIKVVNIGYFAYNFTKTVRNPNRIFFDTENLW
jgi:hypothetical protein